MVSSNAGTGAFTIMSENDPLGHAGEQNLTVDLSGGHNGRVSFNGAWTTASWLELGSHSEPPLPGPGLYGSFNRYDGGSKGHYETVGAQPAGYSFEGSLGELLDTQVPGSEPWFSCRTGTDEFTSRSATCEGRELIGFEGFAYTSQPANVPTVPVYRCHTNGPVSHFDSHDANCEGQTSDGLLGYLVAVGSFNRYDGPNGHYETAGPQPAGYSLEASLGDILMVQVPGSEPWFSCRAGTDEFTSRSSTCEGRELIGFEGYAYTSQPANVPTVPVYRCHTNNPVTHFDSHDPNCEGQTSDGLLGYLVAVGSFNRYVGPNGHYETVGPQPSGYSFEGSLGELLETQVPGTEPWYSCRAGTDEFTSRSSTCEGRELIGFEGYAYTSQPANVPTLPVYRCHTNNPVTHFDSHDPNCEGQTSDGLLGYLLASAGGAFARIPVADTLAASVKSSTSANLSGTVDPEGFPLSVCRFEYGPTTAYGSTASCSPSPGEDEAAEPVSATVSGLLPTSEYHFRVVAVGPGGTSYGADETFTTLPLTVSESTTKGTSQSGSATFGSTPSHSVLASKARRSASLLSRAIAKCRKVKNHHKRARCIATAKKRYGPAHGHPGSRTKGRR